MTSGTMQFYANSYAFVSVLLIILELAILAILLRVAHKSTATRFLIVFFVCLLFNSLAMLWSNAGPVFQYIFIPTQDAFLIAGGVGLIGFAYHYPRHDQPGEARQLMAGFSMVALIAFAYNIYFAYDIISNAQPRATSFYFGLLMPATLLLGIIIFARRAVHFADISAKKGIGALPLALRVLWRPPNLTVLTLRNFTLALAVGIIQAVASAGFVTGILNIHFIAIGAILAISAIALAYFSNSPEPVSFMVKLVGISLVTLLSVLGVNGVNIIEARRAERLELMQSIAADMTLHTIEEPNQPAFIPPEVRYIVSWSANNIAHQAAYRLHFGRNDESMADPAAIMAENVNLLAKDEVVRPPSADQTNLIGRDLFPFPRDYARIAAVQMLREDRIYEVGFLNADNLLRPIHVEAMRQSLVVIVGSLFIIIVFPLFFRRTLVTPLDTLLRGIEQANTGRLDLTLPVKYEDELGFLTRSFNRMVNSLGETQQDLQELTRNLEQRVTERTAELSIANEKLETQNIEFQQTNQRLDAEIAERSQAEQILQLNQQRYSLATQAARVGVWDWNLQTGEFFLDPNIKAILGYTDAEIPNDLEVWTTYIHPDDLQPVTEAAQAHLDGQTSEYIFEHRMLHKDGSVRWVFVHGKVIKDEQGQAMRMIGTDTDITERKEAEDKLKRQIQYEEALAHCSRTLLKANRDETENRRLLGQALEHLIEPARVSKIFLYENYDDPELGFCSRFILDVCAPGIPPALDDPNSAVISWSIVPDENRRRLAAGEPVGGPVRRLFADAPPFRDYLLKNVHVLSIQFFPIHFGEYWWGYIGFDDRVNEREWREEEIVLLGTAAEILSSTLQRWQAEARERRQRQIAENLQEVALILNSSLDQKQIVATILDQLQEIVSYHGAAVWLVEGEELVIVEATGLNLPGMGLSVPSGSNSPQALVVRNRQPRVVADVTNEPEWPGWDEEGIIRSWMGVPLIAGQEAKGLLSLVRSDQDAFDPKDLQVLQSFASQAVMAINNARLYQQVSTARERLSILYHASQAISAASLDPQHIYVEIHTAVVRLMPADVFVVTLIDETGQEAEDVYLIDQGQVCAGQRYPLPGSFAHYLLRRGASLRTDDYDTLPQVEFKIELFGSLEDTRSGLAVLLRRRDRVLGLMSVQSYALATYTDDDLELLELLAAHAAIALENTRLYQQAQTAAVLEERNRLARDLHDSVTQSLYSLTLLAEGWRRLAIRGRLADLDSALTELGEIAQQSLKEMRLLIYELRPPVLEQAGLLGALHQRLGAVERRAGIEARLIADKLIKLPLKVEQGLYRITQEALNNALKHAKATTVTVFVRANEAWIEVEVTDNGCGFEPDTLNGQPGLGLVSMRERAEQLGGVLVIESKPGQGTMVKVSVRGNSGVPTSSYEFSLALEQKL